ncbi:hypothetical protein ACHAWF_011669, partial [Thalassiosira exigua]
PPPSFRPALVALGWCSCGRLRRLPAETSADTAISVTMDLESDDVSALSMDGASALAGMGFARRLRKDFAEMQRGIPEGDDEADEASSGRKPTAPLHKNERAGGDELLEPFPKTLEEWQEKKEKKKKHKHKSKKHDKKSSKSHKSGKSGSKRDKDERRIMEDNATGGGKNPPIMEISIQSADLPAHEGGTSPPRQKHSRSNLSLASDVRSAPSVASTTGSSSGVAKSRRGSSLAESGGHEAMGAAIAKRSLQQQQRSSFRSTDQRSASALQSVGSNDNESMTHMTGHSYVSAGSHTQSHITVEDLHQLRANLERSRLEEKQVLEIHKRLENEVRAATEKADGARSHQESISLELQMATAEREMLHNQLAQLQEENGRLKSKLRQLEEQEDEKGLDDVLDNMEAKIKALKLGKGRRRASVTKR